MGFSLAPKNQFLISVFFNNNGSQIVYLLSHNGTLVNSKLYNGYNAPVLLYSASTDRAYAVYNMSNSSYTNLAVAQYNEKDLSYEGALSVVTFPAYGRVTPVLYRNMIFLKTVSLNSQSYLVQIFLNHSGVPHSSTSVPVNNPTIYNTLLVVTKHQLLDFEALSDSDLQCCTRSYNRHE